jgi:ATP-dependent Lhr-like helicase
VLTRETVAQENLPGGFSAVYDVLKALEESGRVRRGYFVAGLGATQFALPAAVDLLRSLRSNAQPEKPEMVAIAATDPANPYGSVLRWPAAAQGSTEPPDGSAENSTQVPADTAPRTLTRSVGATVVLRNGELVAYLRRNNPNIQVFLPADEPERSQTARDLAEFLARMGLEEMRRGHAEQRGGMLISAIGGVPVGAHFMAPFLQDAGFQAAPIGFNLRRTLLPALPSTPSDTSIDSTSVDSKVQ